VLNAQFLHVACFEDATESTWACRASARSGEAVYLSLTSLLGFAQTFPPRPKFICNSTSIPQRNIPPKALRVNGSGVSQIPLTRQEKYGTGMYHVFDAKFARI